MPFGFCPHPTHRIQRLRKRALNGDVMNHSMRLKFTWWMVNGYRHYRNECLWLLVYCFLLPPLADCLPVVMCICHRKLFVRSFFGFFFPFDWQQQAKNEIAKRKRKFQMEQIQMNRLHRNEINNIIIDAEELNFLIIPNNANTHTHTHVRTLNLLW